MPMLSAYMTAARQAAEELGIENDRHCRVR